VTIDLGDVVTLEFPVLTTAESYANAAAVTLTVTLPDGTAVSPAVANPPAETGRYRCDYPTVQAGRHLVRWTSTTPTSAHTDMLDVRPAAPPLIVSLADVKAHLGKSDPVDDEELREYLEAAAAVIEEHRGETVVRRTVVADMQVSCALVVQLPTAPVQSLTSVATVDGATTWNVADLHVSPHGVVTVRTGPALQGLVRFVFVAGYTVIPANYTLAGKIIVGHLWETQQQQGVGPKGPFGADTQFISPTGRGFAIPNRAVELLGRRPPLVA
jgi:uncharacterized phiE125 gp8 family phage protein